MVDAPAVQYTRTEDGVNIAYTVEHNGPGTPVMLASHFVSRPASEPAGPGHNPLLEGRTVVRFDPRCQGLSDRHVEDVSLAARELDFLAVQQATGVDRVAVHPIGQQVWPAVSYASHHPESVSHLVLLGASVSGDDYWSGTVHGALKHLADTNYEAYTEAHAWLHLARTGVPAADLAPGVKEVAERHRASVDGRDFVRLWEEDLKIDISDELQRLTCRILVSSANDLPLIGYREMDRRFAAQVPNGRLVSPPMAEQWTVFADFIDEDVSQRETTPSTQQPSPGLRSILFTDIEGHTEMMARLGDERGRVVLREHEKITRDALAEHGGTEVKAMGDGFMSWFPSATAALRCAASLQTAFEEHSKGGEPIRVRTGINAGEPMEEDDDLFGTSVIVAARTAASAAGGQIVVTDVVRQLVAGKEFLFADRGLSNLKGFEDPVRTWEVLW